MKFFKMLVIILALGCDLFYLADTIDYNGKTISQHIAAYWQSCELEKKVAAAGKEITDDFNKRAEAVKPKPQKTAGKGGPIEDYTPEERKIITDAIGDYLN